VGDAGAQIVSALVSVDWVVWVKALALGQPRFIHENKALPHGSPYGPPSQKGITSGTLIIDNC